ncbi:MAG: lipopolysaccharide biosynthesis protein [Nocardioides sp.]
MTVTGAGSALAAVLPHRGALGVRSVWLLVAKGLQMGGGFLFWVVAARNASVESVGIAAACVSAIMLCTQLGVLGTGSAVIIGIGEGEDVKEVLDTALSVLGAAALVASLGYLGLVRSWGSEALASTYTPGFVVVFVAATCLGTLVICIDQASLALHHAGGAAPRYAAGGVAAVVVAVLFSLPPGDLTASQLVACWAVGGAVAAGIGLVQLRIWVGYRYMPRLRLRRVLWVLRVGVPNQLLTATERVTPVLVPILLTHTASPTTTAYWYPAWMMAWVAFNAPISVGMVQFNDIVRHPARAGKVVRQGVVWSLALGVPLSLVIAAGAGTLLSLLGDGYADASETALRILLLGLLPFTVLQAYNALCRGVGRTGEAVALGVGLMAAVAVGTVLAGERGSTSVAIMWVGVSASAAALAGWRLRRHLALAGAREDPR